MRYLVTGTSELACTACGQVHKGAKLVTLPDGTQVNNYSEAWRAHTEAKWVLEKLPLVVNRRRKSTPQISRRDYIMGVEHRRGKHAADNLKRGVRALWLASK
jgi:hypothetical protein